MRPEYRNRKEIVTIFIPACCAIRQQHNVHTDTYRIVVVTYSDIREMINLEAINKHIADELKKIGYDSQAMPYRINWELEEPFRHPYGGANLYIFYDVQYVSKLE